MTVATAKRSKSPAVETLQEYVSSGGAALKVDRENGVIRGVKILGAVSKNGRTYLREAIQSAVPLYEGAKVNINHPTGNPAAGRDYQARLGVIRNVTESGDGLFGDLHYNPEHALARQLEWDAQKSPENVGLSHNVEGQTRMVEGKTVVEKITKVHSVDLVADPATTNGLFESRGSATVKTTLKKLLESATKSPITKLLEDAMDAGDVPSDMPVEASDGADADDQTSAAIKALVNAILDDDGLDTAGKLAKIRKVLGLSDAPAKSGDAAAETESKKESVELRKLVGTLREQVDTLTLAKTVSDRKALVAGLLAESKLPKHAITDVFMESLHGAADEAAVKKLIADRQLLAAGGMPVSMAESNAGGSDKIDGTAAAKRWKS